ncbi:MAG: hypothetical protein ACYCQI_01820 [Gammaproteobacteria bacterium]
MVRERGRTIVADAKEKFDAGLLSERNYLLIAEQSKREDKEAEV